MTIPEKALELSIEVNKLTLGEMALFDPEEIGASTPNRLRKFLIAHSLSWTVDDINGIEIGELEQVGKQLAAAIQAAAVPLANSPSSRTGRASKTRSVRRSG